jgi:hypothetical protein
MIELGPATENQMVLAFLRAEVDSPQFGQFYKHCLDQLQALGITRKALLDSADLDSSRDNAQRMAVLKAVRGYGGNTLLFTRFPNDVRWCRLGLEPADWIRVKYANHSTWVDLSGGTRIVADGAKNIDSVVAAENVNQNVKALVVELRKGKRYPELIGVKNDKDEIVLVEGHSRATAYAVAKLIEPVQSIVGSSPSMKDWAFY